MANCLQAQKLKVSQSENGIKNVLWSVIAAVCKSRSVFPDTMFKEIEFMKGGTALHAFNLASARKHDKFRCNELDELATWFRHFSHGVLLK